MPKLLRGKKVLITSGPTWVPIDRVRVISNISTGATGRAIAKYARQKGAGVTLISGPLLFDKFLKIIKQKIKARHYDIIIHSAAISDYKPVNIAKGKISSGKKTLTISLKPAIKIVDLIREYAPSAVLVIFKLEVSQPKKKLTDIAYKAMRRAKADLIVANNLNEITKDRHKAYIIDKNRKIVSVGTKKELASKLFGVILETLNPKP